MAAHWLWHGTFGNYVLRVINYAIFRALSVGRAILAIFVIEQSPSRKSTTSQTLVTSACYLKLWYFIFRWDFDCRWSRSLFPVLRKVLHKQSEWKLGILFNSESDIEGEHYLVGDQYDTVNVEVEDLTSTHDIEEVIDVSGEGWHAGEDQWDERSLAQEPHQISLPLRKASWEAFLAKKPWVGKSESFEWKSVRDYQESLVEARELLSVQLELRVTIEIVVLECDSPEYHVYYQACKETVGDNRGWDVRVACSKKVGQEKDPVQLEYHVVKGKECDSKASFAFDNASYD